MSDLEIVSLSSILCGLVGGLLSTVVTTRYPNIPACAVSLLVQQPSTLFFPCLHRPNDSPNLLEQLYL